jgi:hypothetical protein
METTPVLRNPSNGTSQKPDNRKFAVDGFRFLGILGNSDAASKCIHGAAEKEPGCVIR